jgi:hypothetical protein
MGRTEDILFYGGIGIISAALIYYFYKQQPPPKNCAEHTSEIECKAAGCYWYDNSCHSSPQPPPTETIKIINFEVKAR